MRANDGVEGGEEKLSWWRRKVLAECNWISLRDGISNYLPISPPRSSLLFECRKSKLKFSPGAFTGSQTPKATSSLTSKRWRGREGWDALQTFLKCSFPSQLSVAARIHKAKELQKLLNSHRKTFHFFSSSSLPSCFNPRTNKWSNVIVRYEYEVKSLIEISCIFKGNAGKSSSFQQTPQHPQTTSTFDSLRLLERKLKINEEMFPCRSSYRIELIQSFPSATQLRRLKSQKIDSIEHIEQSFSSFSFFSIISNMFQMNIHRECCGEHGKFVFRVKRSNIIHIESWSSRALLYLPVIIIYHPSLIQLCVSTILCHFLLPHCLPLTWICIHIKFYLFIQLNWQLCKEKRPLPFNIHLWKIWGESWRGAREEKSKIAESEVIRLMDLHMEFWSSFLLHFRLFM
jgi:hypothetical protein